MKQLTATQETFAGFAGLETRRHLTKIASLPGSGGGCMSALPAEVNEHLVKVQMKAAYFDHLEFPPIEAPPTIQELAQKYLDAHEGLGC